METRFSRARTRRAASTRPEPELRWRILDDLASVRTTFDLKDRTLNVLRALLSFLPKGETRHFTVFPSNRTLSERLLGMPESTLRRHLTTLQSAGLIARRDSPNRKRYRVGSAVNLTFGLDLTPLFAAAHHIRVTAQEALQLRQRVTELRAGIRERMAQLDDETRTFLNRKLRCKLSETDLRHLLEKLPDPTQPSSLPPEPDVADMRNERHIQTHSESGSFLDPEAIALEAIDEVARVTHHPLRDERDIGESGRQAALAMSVSSAWMVAEHRKGPIWATMALAHVHRRLEKLRDPGAYLLSLTRLATEGRFDLVAALASGSRRELTAVNLGAGD